MNVNDMLNRLCLLCGIGLDYTDIWGNPHPISEETQRALLGAMGLPVASDDDIRRALESLESRPWQRVLPPVLVVREQESPFAVSLVLPEDYGSELNWILILENGERHEGRFHPRDLQRGEQRQLNGQQLTRHTFMLPHTPGWGYHRLELHGSGVDAAMTLIVAPPTCFRPESISDERRVWGAAVQLYALRSQRNWGIGDFGDLKAVVEYCAEQGAGIVGVSPIHALFPDNPEHASPYGPSSRLFLNVLYLDVEAIPEFAECDSVVRQVRSDAFQAQLRALRAEEMVQYSAVAALKLPILEKLYAHFRKYHLERESERGRAFRAFQAQRGLALHRQALFEALQAHFRAKDANIWGWPAWPEAYRNPESPEVASFLQNNVERVEFHAWMQWQASQQLAAIGRRSWELGLGVGLQLDLAVSISRGGGEGWANQHLYAVGASIGAPPDDFSLTGQDWGLPPFIPHALTEAAYAPFIDTLRAGMRDAGALRIDHVMGLYRLFWVPPGKSAADGAYVYYPFGDLLGILALESQRNKCLVVGEDLGTVPNEVRHGLEQLGVHSYRLQYFEKDWNTGAFKAPSEYPAQALVAVTTHDLATLAGFWQGRDLEVRQTLGLFPSEESRESQIVARAQDCARLLVALERENLLPQGSAPHPVSVPEMSPEYAQAVHAYLARTPSRLMLMQLEDMLGQLDQVNLPGTSESQYPNWRRKLPLNIEEWRGDPRAQSLTETLRRERGSSVQPQPPPLLNGNLTGWRVPRATYRLQFNSRFTFADAAQIVGYLDQLGISHCYASPYLKSRPGSPHGYDIIDHNALNPEIGSEDDFEHFVAALKARGMGQILDIVPNHMGVMGADNVWWLDVLENGPASPHAQYFDIDWFPANEELQGRVLLPVLGDHYGTVLESGDMKLAFDAGKGEFSVWYYGHRFPVDPREYPRILGYGLHKLEARLGRDHPHVLEFQSLVTAFGHLPARLQSEPEKIAERSRDKEILKQHLAALYASSADIVHYVEDTVAEFNDGANELDRYALLHDLLSAQAYRLSYWRVAADEINYRRFFDVNDLAALRMENAAVFDSTHRLIAQLLASGKVDGLRLDHTDGLYDPVQYFQRLRQLAASLLAPAPAGGEETTAPQPLYVVVEKILAAHEHLPEHWPISGTTGYDFLNICNSLFVDPDAAEKMDRIYADFIEQRQDFEELRYQSKRIMMRLSMTGELSVLAHQLAAIARDDRHTCDYPMNSLRVALAEVVACFPVYRTYVSAESVSPEDVRHVDWAIGLAKKRSQAADTGIFDFIRDVLLKVRAEGKNPAYQEAIASFAMKFQQYTSPVMAKGMEDTAFYLCNRLVSLNEVGGDPRRFGVPAQAFHRATLDRSRKFPHAMLASSTHDTKRSEDMRARINALSEMPDDWEEAVARWSRINQSLLRTVDDKPAPSCNDQYLLYQTLIGVWPLEEPDPSARDALCERVEQYMLKAVREAKAYSSWLNPNAEYEDAMIAFVRGLIGGEGNRRFLGSFLGFQKRISRLGIFNSLSQTLLKLTSPGVPDIYQGTEIWDFSLVDPDNRRPVDYAKRQALLDDICREFEAPDNTAAKAKVLLENARDGRIKLYLIWRTLALRRQHEALFRDGDYLPLKVMGRRAEHVCAFVRRSGKSAVMVLVPRLFWALVRRDSTLPIGSGVWRDTRVELLPELAQYRWRNAFTNEALISHADEKGIYIDLATAFAHFPYGLLIAELA